MRSHAASILFLSLSACGSFAPGGGSGSGASGEPDTKSCFTEEGQAALQDPSGAVLAELADPAELTPADVRLMVVFWAAALEGMETGAIRPEFGEAGLYDAVFDLGAKLPGVDPTASACHDVPGDAAPRAGGAYPCDQTCRQHANQWLNKQVPLALLDLLVSKYGWLLDISKDVVVLERARALVSRISDALALYSNIGSVIEFLSGDIDALGDLLAARLLDKAQGLVTSVAGSSALLVLSAGYTIYTLYRDYQGELAGCMADQSDCMMMPVGTSSTGDATTGGLGVTTDTSGSAMPGDPCLLDAECVPGSVCFNQVCVGQGLLRISLTWQETTDLDLHVLLPDGSEIWFNNKMSAGGELDVDQCASGCDPGVHVENVTFPQMPLVGAYEVYVENYSGYSAAMYMIEVAGAASQNWSGQLPAQAGAQSPHYMFTVGSN